MKGSILPGAAQVSRGANWQRIDLHLHTPGVSTFHSPDGANLNTAAGRSAVAKAYVDQMRSADISVGALTDYNGIHSNWLEAIRAEAENVGVRILPGAELSFKMGKYGLHILAIFPDDSDVEQVNAFLRALDRDASKPLFSDGAHRDIDAKVHPADALRDLREKLNCLLIPAHPGGTDGICKSLQPGDAAKLLKDIEPDALEHCSDADVRKLQSTKVLDPRFFEHLALVEFSDPKRIPEIGAKESANGVPRATYLKLSATDIDALRLALHDPDTRLRIGRPPAPSHPRIRRMRVTGSGFLGDLVIEWNDDLNVLIGGRGVGKSAVIETLRFALAIPPYSDESYRESLVRHSLGSGGKVEVELERTVGNGRAQAYRVTRVLGEDARVTEVDTGREVSVPPAELLGPGGGPTIFGQREIYYVSTSEQYRLALLDELIGEEARARADSVRASLDELRANARAVLDIRKALAKRDEHRERLKAIDFELAVYEKHKAAEKLSEVANLRTDGQQLRAAGDALARLRTGWKERSLATLAPLDTAIRSLGRGKSRQKQVLDDAEAVLSRLREELSKLDARGQELLDAAGTELSGLNARWTELLRPLEDEINRIKREAQTEALDPDRLLRLTEEKAGLAPLIEELDRREQELASLLSSRQQLLKHVRERRLAENQLRRERAEAIGALLRERLQLSVEFKGQKEDYKKRLGGIFRGSGVSQDAIERLAAPEATDGIALAEAARAGAEQVQAKFNVTGGMAERVAKWLAADESRMMELETVIPADALVVALRVDDAYRSLEHLSVGQRATAILLLLFALEGRVLVLDQPEDDLDNRFVYEDIVQLLREQKGLKDSKKRRQIIAATHNANIPVIGDAELVIGLDARDGRGQVIGRASIDERDIRELVKSVMEGGQEAFMRRAEKYGGLRQHESH